MVAVCVILLIPLSILMVAMIVDSIKHPEFYKVPPRRKKRSVDYGSIRSRHPRMRRYDAEHGRR